MNFRIGKFADAMVVWRISVSSYFSKNTTVLLQTQITKSDLFTSLRRDFSVMEFCEMPVTKVEIRKERTEPETENHERLVENERIIAKASFSSSGDLNEISITKN